MSRLGYHPEKHSNSKAGTSMIIWLLKPRMWRNLRIAQSEDFSVTWTKSSYSAMASNNQMHSFLRLDLITALETHADEGEKQNVIFLTSSMERPSMEPTCLPGTFSFAEDIRFFISASLAERGRERCKITVGDHVLVLAFNFIPVLRLIDFTCHICLFSKRPCSRHQSQSMNSKAGESKDTKGQESHFLPPTIVRYTLHSIPRPNVRFPAYVSNITVPPRTSRGQHLQFVTMRETWHLYLSLMLVRVTLPTPRCWTVLGF